MNEETISYLTSLSYDTLITILKSFSTQEKENLLQNEKFLKKLLLLDSDDNIWNFERITEVYSLTELLPYFRGEILNLMNHRFDYKPYVYLVPFIRNNKAELIKIFENEEFLKFFLEHGDKIYSELNFDLEFVLKIFNYVINHNINLDNSFFNGLVTYSLDTLDKQKAILENIKDNETIVKLLFLIDKDIARDYLKNHVVGLNNSEVFRLMGKMEVPRMYYENVDFFNNYILDYDIGKMNQKIMELSENNNVTYLENLKDKMLDKVLSLYDAEKETISYIKPDIIDLNSMEPYQAFLTFWQIHNENLSSQELSHKILGNVVLEKLFGENYRNLLIDINEMLSYNKQTTPMILEEEDIKIYKQIINFDEMSSREIMAFFNQYKDQDLKTKFYDNMRQVKNVSYEKLRESCLKMENITSLKNEEETKKYGIDVYELKGEDFTALISCQPPRRGEYAHRIRKCYSLISQDNLKVFNENSIIYGFSHFPIENIIHISEWDEGSSDTLDKESLEYINRIRTPEEILASKVMNEIQIANNYDAENDKYKRIKPDYIVCFDSINPYTVMRAKGENLPILVIDRKLYQSNKKGKFPKTEYYYSPYSNDNFNEYQGKKL